MNILLALWVLMVWYFSTRASVVTVLSTLQCISSYLWVKIFLLSLSLWVQLTISPRWRQVVITWAYFPIWSETNSLIPGRFEWNFRWVIFNLILMIDGLSISCKTALWWMSLDQTDDNSTLVAPNHYLSQCWPRSVSQYGITRTQWV